MYIFDDFSDDEKKILMGDNIENLLDNKKDSELFSVLLEDFVVQKDYNFNLNYKDMDITDNTGSNSKDFDDDKITISSGFTFGEISKGAKILINDGRIQLEVIKKINPKLIETYKKLGIPLQEQKKLSGVAVDAVFDSVSVATTYKEELTKKGIIFCSISRSEERRVGKECRSRWSPYH